MDTWVLRVRVNHHQPIVAHEIDGMIQVKMTPGLLWLHPRMKYCFWRSILMNSTCGALTTEISNVLVNVGPINSGVSQLFHLLNTKVPLA